MDVSQSVPTPLRIDFEINFLEKETSFEIFFFLVCLHFKITLCYQILLSKKNKIMLESAKMQYKADLEKTF